MKDILSYVHALRDADEKAAGILETLFTEQDKGKTQRAAMGLEWSFGGK